MKRLLYCLLCHPNPRYLQLPDVVIKAAKEFPDRLIPFCSIDPRAIIRGGLEGLVDILRKYVDQGAKGFGEHKVGLDFDDPLMMRVYEACQQVRIPLLFHIDNIRGKDQPGLPARSPNRTAIQQQLFTARQSSILSATVQMKNLS